MSKIWQRPCREVLISKLGMDVSIIPTDMDGTVHHPVTKFGQEEPIEVIIVIQGANTMHIKDGNVCLRGYRLMVETETVLGNLMCLVVRVKDSPE